jgi:filamentous hemagglutinin
VARSLGVGFNPGTGGTIPKGSNPLWEWVKVFFADESVHNCYLSASAGCAKYWEGSKEGRSEFVKVKPQP